MKAAELANTIQWGRHLSRMTPQEADTIIKCVRFAADMEVLAKYRPEFLEAGPQVRHRGPWAISISFSGGSVRVCYGSDIYTAARKAVEELEGKRDGL